MRLAISKATVSAVLSAFLVAMGLACSTADAAAPRESQVADGEKPKKSDDPDAKPREGDKGKRPKLKKITLNGKVTKIDLKRKRDDGTVTVISRFYLTEKNGNKVQLPNPRMRDDGTIIDKFDIGFFVGKNVVLTGQARIAPIREGKNAPTRVVRVTVITDVKEVKKK